MTISETCQVRQSAISSKSLFSNLNKLIFVRRQLMINANVGVTSKLTVLANRNYGKLRPIVYGDKNDKGNILKSVMWKRQ